MLRQSLIILLSCDNFIAQRLRHPKFLHRLSEPSRSDLPRCGYSMMPCQAFADLANNDFVGRADAEKFKEGSGLAKPRLEDRLKLWLPPREGNNPYHHYEAKEWKQQKQRPS